MVCIGIPTILLVYSPGNNNGNSHFIWYVPDHEALKNSQTVIEEIKEKILVFHLHPMRKVFINKDGKSILNCKTSSPAIFLL